MDPKVVDALRVLGFKNFDTIPKVKEITEKYRKLALLKHPDRNGGTPAATAEFQVILNAYHVAGDAAHCVPVDPDDKIDLIARKLFQQFQVKSVKENSSSITIRTEKALYSTWMEALNSFAGSPENKGPNGNKFTYNDSCNDVDARVFLTMYHTGKLLVQSERNKHLFNLHFVNTHLEHLFNEVYKNQSSLKLKTNNSKIRTPVTKPTKRAGKVAMIKCHLCSFTTNDHAKLRKHKREHTNRTDEDSILDNSLALPLIAESEVLEPPSSSVTSPLSLGISTLTLTPLSHKSTEKDLFKCFICTDSYYKEGEWELHSKVVHNQTCTFCNETFISKDDLTQHISQHHMTTEAFKETIECSLCSYSCKNNRNLKTHINKKHPDIRKCDQCSYT